jgi:hypothetical protein
MADDLTKFIDALVEKKTFGLEALGGVKELRDKAVRLEADLSRANQRIADFAQEVAAANRVIEHRDSDIRSWTQRQAELENRERKIFDLEKASAVAVAQSAVWDDAFHSIFRNSIVRETINRSVPLTRTYPGGSGDYVERHKSEETIERERE